MRASNNPIPTDIYVIERESSLVVQKEMKLISYEFERTFERENNSWELRRSIDALLK